VVKLGEALSEGEHIWHHVELGVGEGRSLDIKGTRRASQDDRVREMTQDVQERKKSWTWPQLEGAGGDARSMTRNPDPCLP
jgi:hypothetical protein